MRFEDLSQGVQQALVELVIPCMEDLVIGEKDPLFKAMAGTLPANMFTLHLLKEELVALLLSSEADPKEVERVMSQIDRVERSMHRAQDLLLRKQMLQLQQRKLGPLGSVG